MRDFRIVTLYEFANKPLTELKSLGLQVDEREIIKFAEGINALYGGDSPVFTVTYDPRRDKYYLRTHGSVGFAYYLSDEGVVLVQVLPKPFRYEREDGHSLLFLLQLFNMYYQMGLEPSEIKDIVFEYSRQKALDEIFRYLYVLLLSRALSRGLYYEYGELEESSQTVRGRILLGELARRPPWKADLPIRYSVLLEDNPLNRVLKGALEVAVKSARLSETRKVGGVLLDLFGDVDDPRPGDFGKVSFNHLNERFRTVFRLARVMYSELGTGGSRRFLPGVFIRMDELFETLVYKTLKTALGHDAEVRFQVQLPHVIKNANEIEARFGAFFMMGNPLPDIVVSTGNGTCVVEVKYRNLYVYHKAENRLYRKLVRNSNELYQAYTYSRLVSEYRGSEKVPVILIYPRLEGIYNHWIPDLFSARMEDTFEFFDGTRVGVFGYELSVIGEEILLRRNSVVINEDTAENLRSFILALCSPGEV
ncbi:McrC family protein [Thermococcus sp. Bubb.Bath]|uniref:McrC family protein n=1 Tax=Thermococcus sp. Bubb.Bath TaxID=1638242 RepID=UPI001439234B|nr:McrC family protein [Thermococcus sp. Bubb.Bath]NJF24766.1 restriction endonuclease [Thermococcus sp. Bubb.Bath]